MSDYCLPSSLNEKSRSDGGWLFSSFGCKRPQIPSYRDSTHPGSQTQADRAVNSHFKPEIIAKPGEKLDKPPGLVHLVLLMANNWCFSDRVRLSANRLAESGVAALSGLFDLTSMRLVRYATTITRNQHDAEDSVQAALVRVASKPKLLSQTNHPWPYLLRMVRNEALASLRRKSKCSLVANLSDLQCLRLVDNVQLEETHRAVWTALRKIPTPQAEVIVLKIWEEMTFAQIADILDISADTAASRYRYGMKKLTRVLGAFCPEVHV